MTITLSHGVRRMKPGNYEVYGGKVHRGNEFFGSICGIELTVRPSMAFGPDNCRRTSKPVSCKNCKRILKKGGGKNDD